MFLLQISALVICRSVRGTCSKGLFLLCLLFTPPQALLYLEAAWTSEFRDGVSCVVPFRMVAGTTSSVQVKSLSSPNV